MGALLVTFTTPMVELVEGTRWKDWASEEDRVTASWYDAQYIQMWGTKYLYSYLPGEDTRPSDILSDNSARLCSQTRPGDCVRGPPTYNIIST